MFMKRTPLLIAALALASGVYAEDAKPSPSPAGSQAAPSSGSAFKDEKDKLSYTIGVDIGKTLQRIPAELNQSALTQGITDVLGNKPKALTDAELQQVMQAFQQKLAQQREEQMVQKQQDNKVTAEKNKTEGKKFLDSNSKQPGVTTLADGLQYKVVKNGSGEKPKDTDVVEVNYRGTLIDGKEFDSSAKNGGPVSFPVNEVIKGWSEALKLMPVGSKWQLYLPPELAYGDEGEGDDIAPGSTLVFEVELLGIKKENNQAPNQAPAQATPKSE
jgi:FKBP-type peptidyl-prolyl cis-trans isomerase FklB